ncbi:MAG: hypothetical protein ABI823_12315 [Bryobacteraceae bacterium]
MPELTFPPADTNAYPPVQRIVPSVTEHTVKFLPSRPGKSESHGPPESFMDIVTQYGGSADPKDTASKSFTFAKLIEFNFGLVYGESRYFEKINWFLKHKLKCTKTTEKGNFMFSTGEKIYIPGASVTFMDAPIIHVVRKKPGEVRYIAIAKSSQSDGPRYMIPGVDRTSVAPNSNLPGNTGRADEKGQAIAALVQFVAETANSWLSDVALAKRLRDTETPFLQGGGGVKDRLARNEAVVIRVRFFVNTVESRPRTIDGPLDVIGQGNLRDVGNIIEKYEMYPRQDAPRDNGYYQYEYYVATRKGPGQ